MKKIFLELQKKSLLKEISEKTFRELPNEIFIAYSVQYKTLAKRIRNILKDKKIVGFQQVLGCSSINSKSKNILLIGSGLFHAYNLFKQNNSIWIFEEDHLKKVSAEDFLEFEKIKKVSLVNYLNAKTVGIIVSTKPGQQNLKKAINFSKEQNKKFYLFLSNNTNFSEFENFPNINSWINTACPGLAYDSPKIINFSEIIALS